MQASSSRPKKHPLLTPLPYIFQLPPQILSDLSVRSFTASAEPTLAPDAIEEEPEEPTAAPAVVTGGEGGLVCTICLAETFDSIQEQRDHFRSDWHRFNAKSKLHVDGKGKGKEFKAVGKEEFETMVDDLSSISGSEGSSSSSAAGNDQVSTLLKKTKLDAEAEDDEDEVDTNRTLTRTAVLWFTPSKQEFPDTQMGIYRHIFPSNLKDAPEFLPSLKDLQLSPEDFEAPHVKNDDGTIGGGERRWVLLMTAGGHFAGAVIGLIPAKGKYQVKGAKGAGEIRVLKHKTFHRYTTRRKQGGSQSAFDKSNGQAISIGSMLRRAGEVQLREEIRELMADWKEDIEGAERIWLRANVSNQKIFWGYEGASLEKNDKRLRTFPFPTRRPTLNELYRCFNELTRLKLSHLTESALRDLEESYLASLKPKPKPTSAPAPVVAKVEKVKLSEEEAKLRERWRRFVEMVEKGKIDTLATFWTKYDLEMGLAGALPDWCVEELGGRLGTALQIAASAGKEEVVKWLLEEKKADPTVPVPISTTTSSSTPSNTRPSTPTAVVDADDSPPPATSFRTAYDLAPTRSTRNIFRRLAYDHPDWWAWTSTAPGGARVPSGLSAEQEASQDTKKTDRRKGLKEKAKEREAKRLAAIDPEEEARTIREAEEERQRVEEEERKKRESRANVPQKLGGSGPGANMPGGLSAETRMQIERERRARAAEARFGAGGR